MPYFVRCIVVVIWLPMLLGCASQHSQQQMVGMSTSQISTSALASNYKSTTYKGSIDVFGKHISGLFFFKKSKDNDYRFVLMSEIGLSLMSFRMTADSTQLTDCQEFINKPGFTSMIGRDMTALLISPPNISNLKISQRDSYRQIKFRSDDRKYRMRTDTINHQLTELKIKSGMLSKTRYRLSYDSLALPSQITITHGLMPMTIKLNRLKIVD